MQNDIITAPLHQKIDLSHARRVFAFGDVHGRLDLLLAAMAEAGFDADAGDWLVGLGDWLDRGPDTIEIADFIEAQKNLVFVRGNHEQLLWGITHPTFFDGGQIVRNGGAWTIDYYDDTRDHADPQRAYLDEEGTRLQNVVNNAPLAITLLTPKGRRVGMVHADVPGTDWTKFTSYLDTAKRTDAGGEDTIQNTAMWGRNTINKLRKAATANALSRFDCSVAGIDHVFHGHSIVSRPVTHCNRTWIDTGAYKTDNLTFVEVDAWLEK